MSTLLSISIPTYKRIDFLKRLLDQLTAEVAGLCDRDQELISINIFENPSNVTVQKEKLVKSYRYGQASSTWQIHSSSANFAHQEYSDESDNQDHVELAGRTRDTASDA